MAPTRVGIRLSTSLELRAERAAPQEAAESSAEITESDRHLTLGYCRQFEIEPHIEVMHRSSDLI